MNEGTMAGIASPGSAAGNTWYEANQSYLAAALSEVRMRLESSFEGGEAGRTQETDTATYSSPAWGFSQPPALEQLCSSFELSGFERDLLLLCAGVEMDARLAEFYVTANRGNRPMPTFSLALRALPEAHWSALSPARALRYWQLIEVLPADTLVSSPLRINERILHYLAGISAVDERLQGLVRPVPLPGPLPSSYSETAQRIATLWAEASADKAGSISGPKLPIVELWGNEPDAKRMIASTAAALLNLRLYVLNAQNLPQSYTAETDLLLRLWEREAVLTESALLVEADERDDRISGVQTQLLEAVDTPIILSTNHPHAGLGRPRAAFHTGKPTRREQAEIWHTCLNGENVNGTVETLVSQFSLSPVAIRSAAMRAEASARPTGALEASFTDELWNTCRLLARPRLAELAQRIESTVTWNDLVLPEKEHELLRRIALHVRQRVKVYESWGFAGRGSRGLGISALFAGASGTGKTMAAEVLANELRLDLFRIDLSQVVSKYIGETEKNLSRVFDAAEEGASILLFDEADALFGKRSEVKDSHDRYANVEVSYLLQRMEAYRGLAILTSNRKNALDQAFLRRIRFVIDFPFPEVAQRAEMWRRVFPLHTPTEGLQIDRLARLRVSGGNIQNIAIGAAFLAADAQQPVRMQHLLSSTRSEFAKLETPLADAEVAGWV
jgi:hypothetical protein